MTQHIDPRNTARNDVLAAVLVLQQCTKTAANIIPIPGTDGVIAIGPRAWIAKYATSVAFANDGREPDWAAYAAAERASDESEGGHHD